MEISSAKAETLLSTATIPTHLRLRYSLLSTYPVRQLLERMWTTRLMAVVGCVASEATYTSAAESMTFAVVACAAASVCPELLRQAQLFYAMSEEEARVELRARRKRANIRTSELLAARSMSRHAGLRMETLLDLRVLRIVERKECEERQEEEAFQEGRLLSTNTCRWLPLVSGSTPEPIRKNLTFATPPATRDPYSPGKVPPGRRTSVQNLQLFQVQMVTSPADSEFTTGSLPPERRLSPTLSPRKLRTSLGPTKNNRVAPLSAEDLMAMCVARETRMRLGLRMQEAADYQDLASAVERTLPPQGILGADGDPWSELELTPDLRRLLASKRKLQAWDTRWAHPARTNLLAVQSAESRDRLAILQLQVDELRDLLPPVSRPVPAVPARIVHVPLTICDE